MDFLTRSDLTGRLRGLVILLDEKIAPDHVRVADEVWCVSLGDAWEQHAHG